ncbi:MAG: hypothetical protein GDA41_08000 [Rhodospirillales bacterium]|nr:hypothetical protein [Rhodospirillales bacterium]
MSENFDFDPCLMERAGWSPDECYWEELSEEALSVPQGEALPYWREAAQAAKLHLEPDDARQGTSLANLALAAALDGQIHASKVLLQEALIRWQRAASWVANLQPERRARSSLFHFRLLRKHEGAYDRWSQDRFAALYAEGGVALQDRIAGRYRRPNAYQAWIEIKPKGFNDARRLLGAVYLIAPAQ